MLSGLQDLHSLHISKQCQNLRDYVFELQYSIWDKMSMLVVRWDVNWLWLMHFWDSVFLTFNCPFTKSYRKPQNQIDKHKKKTLDAPNKTFWQDQTKRYQHKNGTKRQTRGVGDVNERGLWQLLVLSPVRCHCERNPTQHLGRLATPRQKDDHARAFFLLLPSVTTSATCSVTLTHGRRERCSLLTETESYCLSVLNRWRI